MRAGVAAGLVGGLMVCAFFFGCQHAGPIEGEYRLTRVSEHPVPNSIEFASSAKTIFVDSGTFQILPGNRFRSVLATHESVSTGRGATRVDTAVGRYVVDGGQLLLETPPSPQRRRVTFDVSHLYVLSSVESRFEYERVR